MSSFLKNLVFLLGVAIIGVSLIACNDGGGGGGSSKPPPIDFGDNDENTIVALGDSITEGRCVPAGATYPARLAALTMKNVVNQGKCGERSSEAAARMARVLERFKPGYILILYGANDAIFNIGVESYINNMRNLVNAARGNKTVPVVGTVMPMYDSHLFADDVVDNYNVALADLADEMGFELADLHEEYGTERSFLQSDGLHPTDSGNQLIALTFNDALEDAR